MMNYLILLLFFISCSTYVPVKYRMPSEFSSSQGSKIRIVKNENVPESFISVIKTTISDDDWFLLAGEKDKSPLILKINSYEETSTQHNSSTSTPEKNKYVHRSSYSTDGKAQFEISDSNPINNREFLVSTDATDNHETEIAKPNDNNKLFPALLTLIGNDQHKSEIDAHNSNTKNRSIEKFKKNLSLAILQKISPPIHYVKLEIEDNEDDMEPVEKFIRNNDLQSSFEYLTTLRKSKNRDDIVFNLAIIKEALQDYEQTCDLYMEAYQLKENKKYMEYKAGCETRKSYRTQIAYKNKSK